MKRYAFIHRNFRALSFEQKAIFLAHLVTLVACFFPWFNATPKYTDPFFYNAFKGPAFLIGYVIFCISLIIFLLFLDRLLDKRKIKLTFPENYLYGIGGLEQILLLILAWSVLLAVGNDYGDSEVRFGLFLALIAQIVALVATFLEWQQSKQQGVRDFFQLPEEKQKSKNTATQTQIGMED